MNFRHNNFRRINFVFQLRLFNLPVKSPFISPGGKVALKPIEICELCGFVALKTIHQKIHITGVGIFTLNNGEKLTIQQISINFS